MKKLILLVFALFGAMSMGMAQQMPALPTDPSIKVGKIENGMTYYIRHNALPENRCEFYLVSNVGAIQENPSQDGLAHFLEHMCFNGTKNFPEKNLLNWLESIGASFGGNVNASTGKEVTAYMLNNIPLIRPTVVDSCLLIMHDYSHFVNCDAAEIDAERGVILEEKRTRNTFGWRNNTELFKCLCKGSKFEDCSIIGTEENLKTFKPETLVDFYHTWYRPDMQALIVVGDIDVDEVEAKIKTIFADIPAAVNPQPKASHPIPDNEEPIVSIFTDKEATGTSINLFWKSEAMPFEANNTMVAAITDLLKGIVSIVENERLSDIASKPDADFLAADAGIFGITNFNDVVCFSAACKDESIMPAFEAIYTEAEKMGRYGFTSDEIKRAKQEILSQLESEAKKADTRKNAQFIQPIVRNFTVNSYLLAPDMKYAMAQQLMSALPDQAINEAVKQLITKENLVVYITAPQKEGVQIPSDEEIQAKIKAVRESDIKPNEVEEIPTSFLDAATLPACAVKSSKDGIYDSKEYVLSNGMKLIFRPNDKEKDKIQFTIFKKGGRSIVADKDLYHIEDNVWGQYLYNTGVAEFPQTTVAKMLSGKQVSVYPEIGTLTHGVSGSSTVKDLETALQLAYLYFEKPRFNQDEYNVGYNQIKAVLPNLVKQSQFKFQEAIYNTLFDSPRRFLINEDVLAKANLQGLEKVYRQLFTGANGATAIIAGDFKTDDILPLVQKYLGAIKKGAAPKNWKSNNDSYADGSRTNEFRTQMEQPKVTVLQFYKVNQPYSTVAAVNYEAVSYILNMTYTTTLREDEGGTYGASVHGSVANGPDACRTLQVAFDTNEDKCDRLRQLAVEGIQKLATEGPSAEEFDKTVKNLEKKIPEKKLTTSFWISSISNWEKYGVETVAGYENAVKSLTPEAIRQTAKEILYCGNVTEIIMKPEK